MSSNAFGDIRGANRDGSEGQSEKYSSQRELVSRQLVTARGQLAKGRIGWRGESIQLNLL